MITRPKRRKKKDNPYTLIELENNSFVVSFIDVYGKVQNIKIDKRTFDEFNKFELDDLKELNEKDNHFDYRRINDDYDEILIFNNSNYICSIEDDVEKRLFNEELYSAINSLNPIQKDRIKKYYFDDKTLQEIADEEGCSPRAVKYSIDHAIENLRKKFKE